ncbi:MAG: helix-turn-helix transcriptional regulator [Firmicutes bacterium]|nr:helix-turn-helix transcriptional regulator [Bacillota bacterium]
MFESFDLTKFGEYLRKLRTSLGYTQENVANMSRLATDTLRRIENGEVIPRYDTLIHLSLAYKKDLLAVLASYSNANALFYFYYRFEDVIVLNDLRSLKQLEEDFEEYMGSDSDRSVLVNVAVAEQFKLMLSGASKHFSPNRSGDFEDFCAAMKISHSTFEPELFAQFKYTEFELRILFMIGTCLAQDKIRLSNDILLFCLERLDGSIHATFHEKLLRVKIYTNLSYNYHNLDEHEKAIYFATQGIDFCNKNYLSHCLAALLYRKGMAKFYLGEPDYLESLQLSICMLHIQGAHELAERYKQVTYETYGITLTGNIDSSCQLT